MSRPILCLAWSILLSAACATAGSRSSEPMVDQSTGNLEAVVGAQAEECAGAFFTGDGEAYADCTLPAIVELMGGREQSIAFLAFALEVMVTEGIEFVSLGISGQVEIRRASEDLFAVIPLWIEVLSPEGRLRSSTSLLGVSGDGGQLWHFADGPALNKEVSRNLIPNLPADLVLPAVGPPVLVE